MRTRLALPLLISLAAAATAAVEGAGVAWWSAGRDPVCAGPSPAEACSLNGAISLVAGAFFAVETLAAVLVGLVLFWNGKRLGAGIAIAALGSALVVEHIWLLT
jgi:hypothetical protein